MGGCHGGCRGAIGDGLIPFTGKMITQTETDFRNLNQALKRHVEARR